MSVIDLTATICVSRAEIKSSNSVSVLVSLVWALSSSVLFLIPPVIVSVSTINDAPSSIVCIPEVNCSFVVFNADNTLCFSCSAVLAVSNWSMTMVVKSCEISFVCSPKLFMIAPFTAYTRFTLEEST